MSIEHAPRKQPHGRWVSDQQLAEYYNVTRGTIHRWVKEGILPPPVKITPGTTRHDMVAVIARDEERLEVLK